MTVHYQLVRMLANGEFHSGETLAEKLGVTRAAIWKHIRHIRDELGLEIDSVAGKGYRLTNALDLLNAEEIRKSLARKVANLVTLIEIHDQIDSTNNVLMRKINSLSSGAVCLAEQQTAGKGRRGRTWVSPYGTNVYMSVYWQYSIGFAELSGLSLAAGLAITKRLRRLGVEGVGVKWPNDILWNDRKLAGLLVEVAGEQEGPSNVVVGFGLNTRLHSEVAEEIDQPWVDLAQIPGCRQVHRNVLIAEILDAVLATLHDFNSRTSGALLLEEWSEYDVYFGKNVILHSGNRTVQGIDRGIDASGALIIQTKAGVESFYGGEISLRAVS